MAHSSNIARELRQAGDRDLVRAQPDKKNYAERLSRLLAQCIADALRPKFGGILPDEKGQRQESRARTAKGFKKLDVGKYALPIEDQISYRDSRQAGSPMP